MRWNKEQKIPSTLCPLLSCLCGFAFVFFLFFLFFFLLILLLSFKCVHTLFCMLAPRDILLERPPVSLLITPFHKTPILHFVTTHTSPSLSFPLNTCTSSPENAVRRKACVSFWAQRSSLFALCNSQAVRSVQRHNLAPSLVIPLPPSFLWLSLSVRNARHVSIGSSSHGSR